MPDWKVEVKQQLAGLGLTPTREAEIVEELAQHLEDRYRELLAGGLTTEAAYGAALAELHEGDLLANELRRVERQVAPEPVVIGTTWRNYMLEDLRQDLRYGARTLLKNPGFTSIVVLTLALGIGANTLIFSVVNSVLLRPLPYSEPDRLMMIRETKLPQFPEFAISPGNFLDWKKQNTVFERLVATSPAAFNLTGTGDPERLRGMGISYDFCEMLGVPPLIGRAFLPEEDQPGHNQVVILSHGLWQRRFGGDPEILNQPIQLDGQSYTVIGVMPSTFYFLDRDNELWTPIAFTAQQAQSHGGHSLTGVVGQLKPGVTVDQARAEMSAIAERLAAEYPINAGWNVMLTPLLESTIRRIKPALLLLLSAVVFVLLIACANVANLKLTRAAGRQKEIAIRVALGAGRGRIVRQLLTESLLLALAGGAVGCLLAKWGVRVLLILAPQNLPRISDVALDGQVLMFTIAVTVLTGLVFGLIPALQASKPNLTETMKEAERGSTAGRRRSLVRGSLVVLEVASALVLLVGAGLMINSFMRLQKVDPGFNPDNALTVALSLPRRAYAEEHQQVAFFQQLIEKVSRLAGVQAVGATSLVPLSYDDFVLGFEIAEHPPLPPDVRQSTNFYSVNADYFKAMGIPLLRGRLFTERDIKDSPHVALINETMAKKMFADEDPIGKRITFNRRESNPDWFEIVGVVGDVKHYGLERATTMQTYEPYTQQPFSDMTLVVRAKGDPADLAAAIRGEVLSLDKEQSISTISTLDQLISTSVAQQQFSMLLFGIFAALAMTLACVGIYGVLSYVVTERTHEMGVRLALGAQTADVLRLVVGQGMLLVGAGVVSGLAAALALAKLITSFSDLLYGVEATDPLTFAFITLLVTLVALLACYIPARRATKVDPLTALRYE